MSNVNYTSNLEMEMQNEQLHQTQVELEAARASYFELYDLAPVGYLTLDEKGIIEEVNLTLTQLLGREKSEVVKRPFHHFIVVDDQDAHYLSFKQVGKTGQRKRYQIRMVKKDGSRFWVQVEMVAQPEEQKREYVYRAAVMDISEIKRVERKLKNFEFKQEADKMEAMSILAGGTAHNFNNYLATLLGNISMARSCINKPQAIKERLDNMEKVILQAKDLTEQLFIFASGRKLHKKRVSIKKLVMDNTRLVLEDSHTSCHFSLPDSLFAVEIDEKQITQVLYHVILNAVEAMPGGGTLWVSAENVNLRARNDEKELPLPDGKYV